MKSQLLSDRYQVLDVLGSGGMGQTYIAEDTQLPGNPKCAVKQLKPLNRDPNFLVTATRLFTSEAEILQQLGKHDRIPQLLAYFDRDGEFYLVQEFIDGRPLSAELPLGQRLPESEVVALLVEVLGILEFIHGQGVIHRDIKPDNIIRRQQDGKLVLIDFGAVKQVRVQQATAVGQVSMTVAIGTPGYMPTEQSSGKPRPSSDIYALGMVAIQALTGLLPSQLKEDNDGEVVWQEQAEVSDGLAAVLTKMTRHYFKFRYQSASEVLQALKDLASPNANGDYTPTEMASNGGYTPTEVATESSSTQGNSNGHSQRSRSSSQTYSPRTDSTKVVAPGNFEYDSDKSSNRRPDRSPLQLVVFIALAILLSVLLAVAGFVVAKITDNEVPTDPPLPPVEVEPVDVGSSPPTPSSTNNSQQVERNPKTSAEDFIKDYFELINQGEYPKSYQYLSTSFKQKFNSEGYSSYISWWETVDRVSVEILSATEEKNIARISIELKFIMQDGRTSNTAANYLLAWDQGSETWLFVDTYD